jgi:hypothetical protein
MKPLSKGDPCRVRLHTGEVVEAVYDGQAKTLDKCHFLNSGKLIAIGGETLRFRKRNNSMLPHECVIIGPSCVILPVGVNV